MTLERLNKMDVRIIKAYDNFTVHNNAKTAKSKRADATDKTFHDALTLSVEADDFQRVHRAMGPPPEMRSDRVNALRARIETGSYNIPAADVAAAIVQRADD
jgi:negative regulator of flagellin synthesis FlgM